MKTLLLLLLVLIPAASLADEPVPPVQLLDFTASYCKPCQQMLPILKRMENDGFPIRQVDISEQPEVSRQYRVEAVPTLILLVNGRETERFVGLTEEAVLRRVMNAAAQKLAQQQQPAQNAPAEPADKSEEPSGGKSLGDIFGKMFPRWGRAERDPIIRGQSPEIGAALTGLEQAEAATVRVTVEGSTEDEGAKVRETGTGTIIHSTATESVILTCSHFFQGLNIKSTRTYVEVFAEGQVLRLPAEVVLGNHRLDLAILRIKTQRILPAVDLAARPDELTSGQELVSYGCDEGATPTPLKVTLVDRDRYEGPGNLICSKAPASGRSGGGLYDAVGNLVGVCSCANRNHAEGLYMSRGALDELLASDRLKWLQDLLAQQQQQVKIVKAEPKAEAGDEFRELLEEPFQEEPEQESAELDGALADFMQDSDFPATVQSGDSAVAPEPVPTVAAAAAGPEVTVIIDDRLPGAQKKVIVIPRASPWLMEMLTGDKSEPAPETPPTAVRRTAAKKAAETVPTAEARYSR
ncbi:MAG: hypothetical protein RIT02_3818 [Planctomycetota bacterium]|jgi:thiol-disulfide isomerase/thioredoxin